MGNPAVTIPEESRGGGAKRIRVIYPRTVGQGVGFPNGTSAINRPNTTLPPFSTVKPPSTVDRGPYPVRYENHPLTPRPTPSCFDATFECASGWIGSRGAGVILTTPGPVGVKQS
eukprot:755991-Hanusia_phi.AAC.2